MAISWPTIVLFIIRRLLLVKKQPRVMKSAKGKEGVMMPSEGETTVMAREKWRVQLDFSGQAVAELDELKKMLELTTRAEVIRSALRWLFWCTKEVLQGGTILVEKNG